MVALPIKVTKTHYVVRLLIDADECRRQTIMLQIGGVFAGITVPQKAMHFKGHLEVEHKLPRTTRATQVQQFTLEWVSALAGRLRVQLQKHRAGCGALPFSRGRYPNK